MFSGHWHPRALHLGGPRMVHSIWEPETVCSFSVCPLSGERFSAFIRSSKAPKAEGGPSIVPAHSPEGADIHTSGCDDVSSLATVLPKPLTPAQTPPPLNSLSTPELPPDTSTWKPPDPQHIPLPSLLSSAISLPLSWGPQHSGPLGVFGPQWGPRLPLLKTSQPLPAAPRTPHGGPASPQLPRGLLGRTHRIFLPSLLLGERLCPALPRPRGCRVKWGLLSPVHGPPPWGPAPLQPRPPMSLGPPQPSRPGSTAPRTLQSPRGQSQVWVHGWVSLSETRQRGCSGRPRLETRSLSSSTFQTGLHLLQGTGQVECVESVCRCADPLTLPHGLQALGSQGPVLRPERNARACGVGQEDGRGTSGVMITELALIINHNQFKTHFLGIKLHYRLIPLVLSVGRAASA